MKQSQITNVDELLIYEEEQFQKAFISEKDNSWDIYNRNVRKACGICLKRLEQAGEAVYSMKFADALFYELTV